MQLLISLGSLVSSVLCIVQFSDEANNALQGGDLCSIFYTKNARCVLYKKLTVYTPVFFIQRRLAVCCTVQQAYSICTSTEREKLTVLRNGGIAVCCIRTVIVGHTSARSESSDNSAISANSASSASS